MERLAAGFEVRAQGRRLSGTVLRYGDVSPSHRERFEPRSLHMAEAVTLNLFHDPERAIAWHPKGGLALENGAQALAMRCELPPIPAAERALAEVRAGTATGLSVEFRAESERMDSGIRVIERAVLNGIGLVKNPSYGDSKVEARRKRKWGQVDKAFFRAKWHADRAGACDCQGPECKTVSYAPGAFDESLDRGGELLALAGSKRPIASLKKGSLAFETDDKGGVTVAIDRAVAETLAGQALAGEMATTRVVARPWVDVEASEYQDDGKGHRRFTKAWLRGVIVKPTVAGRWLGRSDAGRPSRFPARTQEGADMALSPWPTDPAALATARADLAQRMGYKLGKPFDPFSSREQGLSDDEIEQARAAHEAARERASNSQLDHLGGAASALIEREAPGAPDAIRDEAMVRLAAYLLKSATRHVETDHTLGPQSWTDDTNHAGAFRKCGAQGLLAPWKVRRAGVIG